ncbi:MAG TPA: hypothetical protein VMM80_06070, partial [Bacteroidota bacterium]|nr:hypothetical protein [Bacteroidota bacterium]
VEETIEVRVRNHGTADADVQVAEHPWRWSQWDIVQSSHPFSKIDQSTVRFPLHVAAGDEGKITYTIRYSW